MALTTQEEILRITTARDTLRAKGVELGISQNTAKLDSIATSFQGVENRGAVSANVKEGETYTIPKGYHNGSGTVSGVAGGGNYNLQSKSVTPTKLQQNVTPDSGYYGLSDVTVQAIPENYQDVSSTTAVEENVLSNKIFIKANGEQAAGTMPNNGSVKVTLNQNKIPYKIPKGYHDGTGSIDVLSESLQFTPTEEGMAFRPGPVDGKYYSEVVIDPIPPKYKDVSGVTATAESVLTGRKIVTSEGVVSGTMPNNGSVSGEIDGLTSSSYTIPKGYHDGTGSVSLTEDIANALAAI